MISPESANKSDMKGVSPQKNEPNGDSEEEVESIAKRLFNKSDSDQLEPAPKRLKVSSEHTLF